MNNQINIQTENVLNAYKNGNQEQKTLLENLFGKEVFQPKDIRERIKTFDDACRELGENHPFVRAYNGYAKNISEEDKNDVDVLAFLKLRVITAALNQGWSPDWTNGDEYKYYPWFCIYTEDEYNNLDDDDKERCCRVVGRSGSSAGASGGLVYANASDASSNSDANVGSRLAFKTRELALYAGKQFIELWCDFVF
jgi:hypothetical protein